jgi:hypothetical protein
MKYLMLIAGDEGDWAARSEAERRTAYERVDAWWTQHADAGRIVGGHQLEPSSTATTVRVDERGNATITDGPFAESKEMVGGYAVLDVADLDEALALASSWPERDTLEIRPIVRRDG